MKILRRGGIFFLLFHGFSTIIELNINQFQLNFNTNDKKSIHTRKDSR